MASSLPQRLHLHRRTRLFRAALKDYAVPTKKSKIVAGRAVLDSDERSGEWRLPNLTRVVTRAMGSWSTETRSEAREPETARFEVQCAMGSLGSFWSRTLAGDVSFEQPTYVLHFRFR